MRLWRQRKAEFLLSIAAFLGVALLGVLPGIAIAVALSILNVFRRAWWPYATVLGRVDGVEGYHDTRSYPGAEHLPGLVIYRFDGPLFFANATTFRDEIRRLARAEPKPSWILIAAEPVTDVDTTAADVLTELDEALNAQGISLVFAELKDPVRRKIERYGLTRTIDPQPLLPDDRRRHRRLPRAKPAPSGPATVSPTFPQHHPSARWVTAGGEHPDPRQESMSASDLAIVAGIVFLWGTLSARLERYDVTAPIVFVLAGLVLTHGPLALLGFAPSHELVKALAEITLVLVLFSDASRVRLRDLRS